MKRRHEIAESPEFQKIKDTKQAVRVPIINALVTHPKNMMDKYYAGVTRYTTSGFLRMMLGDALEKRGVAPHIYESAVEAELSLQEIKGSKG